MPAGSGFKHSWRVSPKKAIEIQDEIRRRVVERPLRGCVRLIAGVDAALSPKGDKIAFTARDERYRFDVFTVSVNSGEIVRLTQDQGNNEEPSWSPDGRYIVFTSTRGGAQRVWVMTADGAHQTFITPKGGGYSTPAWGPRP